MTVSEITVNTLKDWLGISDGDENTLTVCLTAAKSRAVGYTGLTLAELDEHEDITVAVLGIVSDFYTNNRPDTAEMSMNKMSKSLLDMHSKNLL